MYRIKVPVLLALVLVSATLLANPARQGYQSVHPPEWTGEAKQAPPKLIGRERYQNEWEKMETLKGEDQLVFLLSLLAPMLKENPSWSEGWLLQANLRMGVSGISDLDLSLSDIDRSIESFASTKYKKNKDTLIMNYASRAFVKYLKHQYEECLDDLELSYKEDYEQAHSIFYGGGEPGEQPHSKFIWGNDSLNDLEKKIPSDYRVHIIKGLYYYSLGIIKENYLGKAEQQFELAAKINPKSPVPFYYLGKTKHLIGLHANTGKKGYDATAYNKLKISVRNIFGLCIKKDKTFWPAYEEHAELFDVKKNSQDAMRDYQMVIKLRPGRAKAYTEVASLEFARGNNLQGIWMLDKAIDLQEPFAIQLKYLYERRAAGRIQLGQHLKAIDDYTNAIRIDLGTGLFTKSITPFRNFYPEFKDYSDSEFIRLYHSQFKADYEIEDFQSSLEKDEKWIPIGFHENFRKRFYLYVQTNQLHRALGDYHRAKLHTSGQETPDRWVWYWRNGKDNTYIDFESIESPVGGSVILWLKTVTDKNSELTQLEIDISRRLIREKGGVAYDSKGKFKRNLQESNWQNLIPSSLGEQLFRGFTAN